MSFIINPYITNTATPIPAGTLIIYMRFNNTLVDQTGNHSPASAGTPSYVNGLYSGSSNEAVDFDTDGDYATISDHNDFSFGDGSTDSAFSVTTGIEMDTHASKNNHFIICKRGDRGTSNAGIYREWQFQYDITNSGLLLSLFDDSAGANLGVRGNTSLSAGTTYHVGFPSHDRVGLLSSPLLYTNLKKWRYS